MSATSTSTQTSTPTTITRKQARRALVSATVGTTIEWYDFNIYTAVAALAFPTLFFPSDNLLVSTLASFATYTVGFVARPLGGIVFGHIGDRLGRKGALVSTLLIMGLATLAIGFLPTYQQVGVTAPILLVILRIIQGIGVGGEWGGAVLIAMEAAPPKRRGFFASWSSFGTPLSLLIGTGVIAIVSNITGESFVSSGWLAGWRIPFYLSVVMIFVGLYMRLRVSESASFSRAKQERGVKRAPVLSVLKENWRDVLAVILMRAGENGPYYILSSFILVYGTQVLQLDREFILACLLGAAAVAMAGIPFFGWLSDRVGNRKLYFIGTAVVALMIFPYFGLINAGNNALTAIVIVVCLIPWTAQYGPQPSIVAQSFPVGTRYSGASLGYQLGSPIWGGFAPLIAIALLTVGWWSIAIYVVVLCVITLVSSRLLRDNTEAFDEVRIVDDAQAAAA